MTKTGGDIRNVHLIALLKIPENKQIELTRCNDMKNNHNNLFFKSDGRKIGMENIILHLILISPHCIKKYLIKFT